MSFLVNLALGLLFGVGLVVSGMADPAKVLNFLEVSAQLGILAVAVCLLMIGGEFDLSLGSMIAFAGVIIAIPSTVLGWPIWLCILLAFGAAILVGYLNGWLVVKTGLPSMRLNTTNHSASSALLMSVLTPFNVARSP